jgi:transcriptional regulator with XRE-family HTH domain
LDYSKSDFYSGALRSAVDKSITSNDYRTFLRELRAARERCGLTQIDLASRLGETQSFVSKCERGERRLDISEVRLFCQAFGISLTTFARRLERALATNIPTK